MNIESKTKENQAKREFIQPDFVVNCEVTTGFKQRIEDLITQRAEAAEDAIWDSMPEQGDALLCGCCAEKLMGLEPGDMGLLVELGILESFAIEGKPLLSGYSLVDFLNGEPEIKLVSAGAKAVTHSEELKAKD